MHHEHVIVFYYLLEAVAAWPPSLTIFAVRRAVYFAACAVFIP